MVEKMMYDQRQKEASSRSCTTIEVCVCVYDGVSRSLQMGLPTSDDQKKQDILKK